MPHPPPPAACAFSRIAGAAGHGLPLRHTVSRCNLAVSRRTACNGSPDTCHANRRSPRAARGQGRACASPCGPLGSQQVPTRELRQQFALAANALARDALPVMRHGERAELSQLGCGGCDDPLQTNEAPVSALRACGVVVVLLYETGLILTLGGTVECAAYADDVVVIEKKTALYDLFFCFTASKLCCGSTSTVNLPSSQLTSKNETS